MSAFIVLGGAEPVYITHNVLMKVCRDFGNDAQNNFGLFHFVKAFEPHAEYKSSQHLAGTEPISKTNGEFLLT